MRVAIYADLVYRRDERGVSADRAFVHFVTGLASRVDELVLVGRLDPTPGRLPYAVPPEVRFVPLPHYRSVADVAGLLRAVRASTRTMAAVLADVDVVWLFGPHPLAVAFAAQARRRGVLSVLGVRQDFPLYVANRASGAARPAVVAAAHALELAFRRLARRSPTVAVGEALGRAYANGRAPVLVTGFSLVRERDLVDVDDARARDWTAALPVVTVGRLDGEKNPLLLADVLRVLRARDPRWRLVVVGDGPLRGELERRARELGVDDALELRGYVPNGDELRAEYRRALAFLHVSLTEGVPQVLFEAQAQGLPVVATDVGGVAAALDGGTTGLLVPPRDAHAAAAALERLRDDEDLRRRLVEAGLERAREETLDRQLDRLVRFFARELERVQQSG